MQDTNDNKKYVSGKWSDTEIQDLKYMVSQNFRIMDIAEVLGRTENGVSAKMKYMGLKTSPRFKDGLYLCITCRTYKEKTEFWQHKNMPYGIISNCKECTSKKTIEKYHEKKFQKIREDAGYIEKTKEEVNGSDFRTCTKCKQTKNINEFQWQKKFKKIKAQCAECRNEENRLRELKKLEERGY